MSDLTWSNMQRMSQLFQRTKNWDALTSSKSHTNGLFVSSSYLLTQNVIESKKKKKKKKKKKRQH